MKRITVWLAAWLFGLASAMAARVVNTSTGVIVYPDSGETHVVQLEVVGNRIVRVRATCKDALPQKPASLIVVPQNLKGKDGKVPFTVREDENSVYVKASEVQAVVDKANGTVVFFDKNGKRLLGEAKDGKRFWPYRVPDREIGVDKGKVSIKNSFHNKVAVEGFSLSKFRTREEIKATFPLQIDRYPELKGEEVKKILLSIEYIHVDPFGNLIDCKVTAMVWNQEERKMKESEAISKDVKKMLMNIHPWRTLYIHGVYLPEDRNGWSLTLFLDK